MTIPVLEGRGLVKRFGQVEALRGANFTIFPGEIVSLVGDNGAGKSTLVKVLVGTHQPDEGEMHHSAQGIIRFREVINLRPLHENSFTANSMIVDKNGFVKWNISTKFTKTPLTNPNSLGTIKSFMKMVSWKVKAFPSFCW